MPITTDKLQNPQSGRAGMWLAMRLEKTAAVGIDGREVLFPFSDAIDGCCGVLLAFDSLEKALAYSGGTPCNLLVNEHYERT